MRFTALRDPTWKDKTEAHGNKAVIFTTVIKFTVLARRGDAAAT
jgi:hypothetical protein